MLRGCWALIVFVVVTPLLGSYAVLVSLLRGALGRSSEIELGTAQAWARSMLWATGARVEPAGLEHATRHAVCIFAVNHASNLDIWAVMPYLPARTKFVAKESLFRWPFIGWAMRRFGFIPIDRSRRQSAIQSLHVAAERIRAGRSVIVFPEGTRSRDGALQPFKKGPFHLALEAGVPVVPVAITGSWDVLRPGDWRVRPGAVRVRFLPPIDVRPFRPDGQQALLEETHAAIARALAPRPSGTARAGHPVAGPSRGSTSPCDSAP